MRLYFHLANFHGALQDSEGVEVRDLGRAVVEAFTALRELRHEIGLGIQDWSGWRLNMTDATGAVFISLNLDGDSVFHRQREAVTLATQPLVH